MEEQKKEPAQVPCKLCKEPFAPYENDTDCRMCHDGDYETDIDRYDGGTDIVSCPFCGGRGSYTALEKTYCKSCIDYLDDDDFDFE